VPRNRRDKEESTFYPRGMPGGIGRDDVALQKREKVPFGVLRRETLGYVSVDKYLWAGKYKKAYFKLAPLLKSGLLVVGTCFRGYDGA
jgi:hypothetical protein